MSELGFGQKTTGAIRMRELDTIETEPAPQRRTDPVRPRRVMLPDSLGVPRSLAGLEKTRHGGELKPHGMRGMK